MADDKNVTKGGTGTDTQADTGDRSGMGDNNQGTEGKPDNDPDPKDQVKGGASPMPRHEDANLM